MQHDAGDLPAVSRRAIPRPVNLLAAYSGSSTQAGEDALMDICMLVPWEREKLRKLLSDFNTARERLLAFLEIIEEEWIEEYLTRLKHSGDWIPWQAGSG